MNGQFQNQALLETQSPDRFQFGIFVAILFHAILVFGIGFSWQKQLHRNEVLEFTLVQSADSTSEMIESPDIMAQRSQLGGGEDTASKQATIDELPIDSQQPFQIPEAGVDESSELQSESGAETLISERESDRALNRQVDQLSELTRQRVEFLPGNMEQASRRP